LKIIIDTEREKDRDTENHKYRQTHTDTRQNIGRMNVS
jgi:hypothetical protein